MNNGVSANSVEAGPQEWAVTCGVCHVGGGQMEYDRDRNSYNATTTASGDRYYYQLPRLGEVGGLRDAGNSGLGAVINDTNKAEVDCLMCHLHDATGISGNGYAWYQSMGCGVGKPIGPANDPTCSGTNSGMYAGSALPAVVPFTAGTKYDMFNRNLAIKTPSYKIADARFDYAGSMGIGAIGTIVGGKVTGITGMPTTILGANIQSTPNSQNCAVCHARDDSTVGLPGMAAMKFGYGNYLLEIAAGTVLDEQTVGDIATTNAVEWKDFGCKTGMGKRAHKIGAGLNDKWGMSMFVPSTFNGTCNHADKPCAGDLIVPAKMPDADVHSIAPRNSTGFTAGQPTGIECGTCHFALGSMKSTPTSSVIGTGETQAEYFAPSTHHGVAYEGIYVQAIDHQFAQGDSSPDTKARNNFDGTVNCESCHTTRTHPRLTDNGGTMVSPTPAHAGFPAVHIQKIACTTCHIPEVYAAPGRLKYRDWTTGFYKNGQRNMLDWNYDLVTGSHNTVPMVHAWLTKYGETKIYPFLPSLLPIWMQTSSNSGTIAGSEIVGGVTTAFNGGTPPNDGTPPLATQIAVAKSREVTDAFLAAKAAGALSTTRINQGNMVPLFDGFSLADSWAIDTKTKLDAMVTAGAGKLTKLQIHNTLFDATHGVAPKEWALGSVARGGCVSCHSSMKPGDINYSNNSTGFFEGYQQPVAKAGKGIGSFDFVKNWFAMFADYDCTQMVNYMCAPGYCVPLCMGQMGYDNATCTGFCSQATTACVGGTGPGGSFTDNDLFNPMTGAPANNAFLGACTNLMASTFDVAMGFPAGTAMQMGMYDGIAGLQGFVIRETTSGMSPCNPFAGPVSFSPMGANANVNACIPNPSQPGIQNPPGTYIVPPGAMFAGTCNGAAPPTPGACSGGFRDGGPCMANADCQGSMASPMPLLYSRGEMRNQFKIDLQQSNPGTGNRLTWPISVEKNPSNATHVNSWDQAAVACITNPLTGETGACADGMSVSTQIPANAFLGYKADQLAYLKGLGASLATYLTNTTTPASALPVARFSYMISGMTVTFDASASTAPTGAPITSYSWNFGDTFTGSGRNPAAVTYLTPGTKTITLTVANAFGGSSTKTMSIVLSNLVALSTAPTASFSVDSINGMMVTITPIVSGTTSTQFVNWGDGSAQTLGSSSASIAHTYGVKGTYRIILAASNSYGATSTIGRTVNVPVMATISGTVTSGTSTLDAFITVYNSSNALVASTYSGGAAGSYSVSVPLGTYTVKASKYGYTFVDQTAVVAGTTANFIGTAITPTALYSISGTIDNAPVGLLVVCHPTGSVVVLGAQFTNGVGFFNFTGLANGTYDITMDLSAGATSLRTLTINNAPQVISAGTWTYQ